MSALRNFREFNLHLAGTAPLVPAALGLIVGIVIDHECGLERWVGWAALGTGVVTACLARARGVFGPLLVFVAALGAGALHHSYLIRTAPKNSIERVAATSSGFVRVRGNVASPPRVIPEPPNPFARWSYGEERTAFVLEVREIESSGGWSPVSGLVRVTFNEVLVDVEENDSVELFGLLKLLEAPRNPGGFDWAAFNRSQGIVARFICGHRESLVTRGSGEPQASALARQWMGTKFRGWLMSDLATPVEGERGLLEAMVLGQQSQVDRKLNDVFIRSGCVHFLAASGTNVVIVFMLAGAPLRFMGVSRRKCAVVMIAVAVAYALITDARPPILRATIIGIVFCVSLLFGRTRSHLNWICLTAIILALIDPAMIFDVGYQLSSAAVIGVSYLAPALAAMGYSLRNWIRIRVLHRDPDIEYLLLTSTMNPLGRVSLTDRLAGWLRKIRHWVFQAFAVVFGAWLMALPITATYFQQVQPWGAINSVIIFPLMSMTMGFGFAKLVLTPLSPTLAMLLASPLGLLDRVIVRVVRWMAELPHAGMTCPKPPWWIIVSFYSLLFVFIFYFRIRTAGESIHSQLSLEISQDESAIPSEFLRRRKSGFVLLGSSVAFLVSLCCWLAPASSTGAMKITALAVGRGSATVIELPNGATIIYDTGSSASFDVGAAVVVPFLRHQNISSVDRIYVSHPNLDHFSGIPSVLNAVNVGPVVLNEFFEPLSPPSSPALHFLRLLKSGDHQVETLDLGISQWEIGGVEFELLWPPQNAGQLKANDTSTVLRVTYAGYSVLFTGDIEEAAQEQLIDNGDIKADVLFLPHHGSVRRNTGRFIRAVSPQIAIRSASERMEDNTTGLPETIGDVPLLNTADVGAIEIRIDTSRAIVGPALEPLEKRYKVVK